jgi:hypothetical protein
MIFLTSWRSWRSAEEPRDLQYTR